MFRVKLIIIQRRKSPNLHKDIKISMMFLQQYNITTNKQTYLKFVGLVIGFIVLLYIAFYIFNIFLGSIDENSYRNDLNESVVRIKESVELSQADLDFLDTLSKQCVIETDLSRFSNDDARRDYVTSILQKCGPNSAQGPFINEYDPIEAFDPDQLRGRDSNPFIPSF